MSPKAPPCKATRPAIARARSAAACPSTASIFFNSAVAEAVKDYSAGKQEYRNDEGGNIHCVLGKMSFSDDQLLDNLKHFHDTLEKIRPSATKGAYLKKLVVSGTMTPGVHVAV